MTEEVMSLETIQYWWDLLCKEHRLGWSRDEQLLARQLGFKTAHQLRRRLMGDLRMSVRQQKYADRQLQRILAGEVQCVRMLVGNSVKGMAVVASSPTPLPVHAPRRAFVTIGRSGVRLSLQPAGAARPATGMPSFKALFDG